MALTKVSSVMSDGFPTVYDVKSYGARGDGTTDDAAAINAAITAANAAGGGTVYFPAGDYKTDSQVTLQSNIELRGDMNARLTPSDTVPSYAYYATGESNIRIQGLVFEGTGTIRTAGTQRLLQIDSSSEIQIHNCTFRKARSSSVVVDNCDQGRISECLFENSAYTGLAIRNGCFSWVVSDCIFYQNGNTLVSSTDFGRGIVIWESARINVTNCTLKDNSEYGIRFYSEAGDSGSNQQIAVSNCTFENNGTVSSGGIDFYIYNEIGTLKNFAITNCTFRVRSGKLGLAVQATSIAVSNCSFESASQDQGTAISFYEATNASISNCVITGFQNAFIFSPTEPPDQINIGNCQIINCYQVAGNIYGNNNVIHDCYIKQSSAGLAAPQTVLTADAAGTTGTKIVDNTFDSCYRAIQLNIDNCDVEFSGNTCVNTGNITVRCYGTDLTNLIFYGNKLDAATIPAVLGKIQRMGGTLPMVIGKSDVAPTGFTFAVGDMVFNSGATAGGKAGWICTTAGTPGTWKPFGAIDA